MMGVGFTLSHKLGRKVMSSTVPLVWLGQTSKPVDTPILHDFSTSNQTVSQFMGGENNWNLSLNKVILGL